MGYRLIEVEATEPLPSVALAAGDDGYGLIVRRKGRVVGFLLRSAPPGGVLSSAQIAQVVGAEIGTKLLEEAIREELEPPAALEAAPSLTIAICTKDRPDLVDRCLRSIVALDLASSPWADLEILVVDNAPSDDRTGRVVERYEPVRRVVEPLPGLNFARNRALKEAQGDLLAFVDDDVVVDRNWLSGLFEAWGENPDAGCFTGQVLPYELATEAQVLFELRGGFRRGFEKRRYGKTLISKPLHPCGSGIFGAGANMTFRRDALLRLGGFDEALDTGAPLPGGGDLDIFYRVLRAGYPLVYEPQYTVFHEHRRTLEKLKHQYWTWGLALMAFNTKSYLSDPLYRSAFRRLIIWWFLRELWQLQASLRRRHVLRPGFILAELWGGVVGICGEYPRSRRRIARIHRKFA